MSDIKVTKERLGRVIIPDLRDTRYLMKSLLPKKAPERTYRYWWANGWWGDQGLSPECVAYSWLHWAEDGPITAEGTVPILNPNIVYQACQLVDEWEGEQYDGTSVRAGAKVLQSSNLIKEYRWAWDLDTAVNAVLELGPVVLGTHWTDSMFYPDKDNIIKYEGSIIGGHAYLLNGVNTKTGMARIKNSWGRGWGNNGHAYISFEDLERLIKVDGEACIAVALNK